MTFVWWLQVTDEAHVPSIRCALWNSLCAAVAAGFLFLCSMIISASDAATFLERRLMYLELIVLCGLSAILWSSYNGVKASDAGKLKCACWGNGCCVFCHALTLALILAPLAAISHQDDRPCCEPCRAFCVSYVPPAEEEPRGRPDLGPALEFTFRLTCHTVDFGDSCALACEEECNIQFTSFGFLVALMVVQCGLCVGNIITAHYSYKLKNMAALDVQLALPPPPEGSYSARMSQQGGHGSVLGMSTRYANHLADDEFGRSQFSQLQAGGGGPMGSMITAHAGNGYGYADRGPGVAPWQEPAMSQQDPYGPPADRYLQAPRTSDTPMPGVNEIAEQLQLQLRQRLTEFARNPNALDLHLEATLEAGERRFVHLVCAELGLTSASAGEGASRHVVASKAAEALGPGLPGLGPRLEL